MRKGTSGVQEVSPELFALLVALKEEHPELLAILREFDIDQGEYDKAMLGILSAQFEPQFTYATGEDIHRAQLL